MTRESALAQHMDLNSKSSFDPSKYMTMDQADYLFGALVSSPVKQDDNNMPTSQVSGKDSYKHSEQSWPHSG